MPDIGSDLNATITAAVNARIEASVAEALSGNKLISDYVAAALSREITIRDPGGYRDRKTTFLREVIENSVKAATEQAVRKVVAQEQPALEAAVAEELRRNTTAIAAQLVGKMAEATEHAYGVRVELQYAGRS